MILVKLIKLHYHEPKKICRSEFHESIAFLVFLIMPIKFLQALKSLMMEQCKRFNNEL